MGPRGALVLCVNKRFILGLGGFAPLVHNADHSPFASTIANTMSKSMLNAFHCTCMY